MVARISGPLGRLGVACALILAMLTGSATAHRIAQERPDPPSTHLHGPRDFLRLETMASARAALDASAAAPWLADGWCGTPAREDRPDVFDPALRRLKVVYAHPRDQAARFAAYADVIQRQLRHAAGMFASAPGSGRSLRLDIGTECGTPYVDVQVVELPRPQSAYTTSANPFVDVVDDVEAALSPSGHLHGKPTRLIIYADHLATAASSATGGAGIPEPGFEDAFPAPPGSRPHAVLFGGGYPNFHAMSALYAQDATTHEITHALGAVAADAPHATGRGHCFDEWDVMCYADGGSRGLSSDLTFSCATDATEVLDCGGDDYFNPSPTAGSYLTRHFNVYSSSFLCDIATCGGSGAPAPAPEPPAPGGPAGSPPAPDAAVADAPTAVDDAAPADATLWPVSRTRRTRTLARALGVHLAAAAGRRVTVTAWVSPAKARALGLPDSRVAHAVTFASASRKTVRLRVPPAMRRALGRARQSVDVYVTARSRGRSVRCVITLRP